MCAYNLLFLSSPRHMCDLTALGITLEFFVQFTCSQMNVPRTFSFPLVLFVFPGQYAILYSIQITASSFLFEQIPSSWQFVMNYSWVSRTKLGGLWSWCCFALDWHSLFHLFFPHICYRRAKVHVQLIIMFPRILKNSLKKYVRLGFLSLLLFRQNFLLALIMCNDTSLVPKKFFEATSENDVNCQM